MILDFRLWRKTWSSLVVNKKGLVFGLRFSRLEYKYKAFNFFNKILKFGTQLN